MIGREQEWNSHFRIVLKEIFLSSFIIELIVLVLPQSVERFTRPGLESLTDMPGGLAVENGRLETTPPVLFLGKYFMAQGVRESDGAGSNGNRRGHQRGLQHHLLAV